LHSDYPSAKSRLSKGHAYDLKSNVLEKLTDVFCEAKPENTVSYIRIFGRVGNERAYRYIRTEYINDVSNLYKWKIFVPKANGSGALGEGIPTPIIGQPVIGRPGIGHTESFISIGSFNTEEEAKACYKFICTKFARCMLGILKVTQDNPPEKWKYVPLQDFTPASDIDWSKSIPEIDRQLYAKYGLDDAEIAFIESHVKEMN
jgi:type II restriction enzyme